MIIKKVFQQLLRFMFIWYLIVQLNIDAQLKPSRRKHKQDLRSRFEYKQANTDRIIDKHDKENIIDNIINFKDEPLIINEKIDKKISIDDEIRNEDKLEAVCPPCPIQLNKDRIRLAIDSYWCNDLFTSYACACQVLQTNDEKISGIAQSILYSLSISRYWSLYGFKGLSSMNELPKKDGGALLNWEILGPMPVGKLEVDGDPTFSTSSWDNKDEIEQSFKNWKDKIDKIDNKNITIIDEREEQYEWEVNSLTINVKKVKILNSIINKKSYDIGQYILSLPVNTNIYSEVISFGVLNWKSVSANKEGVVEVRFPVAWQDLVQGTNSAGYEFQGWGRISTYVKAKGNYILHCYGVHTIYVRNDNLTRTLIGDVYQSGQVKSIIELKPGPVGIILPLRGSAMSSFQCTLNVTKKSLHVISVSDVPNLLEIPTKLGGQLNHGLLLTSSFNIVVQNTQSNYINIELQLEKTRGIDGDFELKKSSIFNNLDKDYINNDHITDSIIIVGPGQIMSLPLEFIPVNPINRVSFIPCRKNLGFDITLIPSRGISSKIHIELQCRRYNESFLVSYTDHDGSITQSAVILPLTYSPDDIIAVNKQIITQKQDFFHSKSSCLLGDKCSNDFPSGEKYPTLLTMHGTGISSSSQADAYKMMIGKQKEYTFGVHNYWIIAPTRKGAHNWESIGELTAKRSLQIMEEIFSRFPNLPQVRRDYNIIGGHSMGGHGAWIMGVNNPNSAICLSSAAGWIRKEEYATSNSFFSLDISNSYIDLGLKSILEMAMSEYHVDKLIENLQFLNVHIRVGSNDLVTHPWFSRRINRLLHSYNINSTLDEIPGKQHWWWDTKKENDGGVLNDLIMRNFYSNCFNRYQLEIDINKNSSKLLNNVNEKEIEIKKDVKHQIQSIETYKNLYNSTRFSKCSKSFSLTVINVASQKGICGMRLIQQFKIMKLTKINMKCIPNVFNNRECYLHSGGNVRRLFIDLSLNYPIMDLLIVDGFEIGLIDNYINTSLELCWNDINHIPCICQKKINPLFEKLPRTFGPVRLLYSKPFIIVYGTPQDKSLRLAMRDLAVYIGNSHFSSHNTYVKIITDVEYRSGKLYSYKNISNVMFIGGPIVNKAVRRLCKFPNDSNTFSHCRSSVEFDLDFNSTDNEIDTNRDTFFKIGPHIFKESNEAVVYTLPLIRYNDNNNDESIDYNHAMGVLIHANSLEGYLHLSRLAWSVVPPMVRSPFSNYIPDFIVINEQIWSKGLGCVKLAGFWDSTWQFDKTQAYVDSNLELLKIA